MIGRISAFTLLLFINLLQGCEPKAIDAENQEMSAKQPFAASPTLDLSLCQFTQGPCQLDIKDLALNLTMTPATAPSEKPLQFLLSSDQAIEDVSIRIEGRDMFMGVIPVKVTQLSATSFQGDFIYGSCSSNYMVWRALISFSINKQPKAVYVDFLADDDSTI
jgi:hypothetical protein